MDMHGEEEMLQLAAAAARAVAAAGGPLSVDGALLVPTARDALEAAMRPNQEMLLRNQWQLAREERDLKVAKVLLARLRDVDQKEHQLLGHLHVSNDVEETPGLEGELAPLDWRPWLNATLPQMEREVREREQGVLLTRGAVRLATLLRDAGRAALEKLMVPAPHQGQPAGGNPRN
jgi:hypothetical protein